MNIWEKQRQQYRQLNLGYYHLSTDGWKDGLLFHQTEQYAYGMTLMGLLTIRFELVIYDFTLMPNHLHILLKGTGETCLAAFDYFRRKLSARLVADGYPSLPEDYGFKLTAIESREQMRTNYLYLARNPYERNESVPGGHPWGAAYLHFAPLADHLHGFRADGMSKRKLEKLTGSRSPIPPAWEFHPQLGLLPACFIDSSMFKKLFLTPKDYQTHLVKDYESFVKLGRRLEEDMSFSSEEIFDIVHSVCRDLYPGKRPASLSNDEKGQLCVLLQKKYALSPLQMADTLHISEYLVRQLLAAKDYGRMRR